MTIKTKKEALTYGFNPESIAGRVLTFLKDGRFHGIDTIIKRVEPRSGKQLRNNGMPYLARYGRKNKLYLLEQNGEYFRLVPYRQRAVDKRAA